MSLLWWFLWHPITQLSATFLAALGCILPALLIPKWVETVVHVPRRQLLEIGAVLMVLGVLSTYWFNRGETHMLNKLAARDDRAVQRADQAKGSVDKCYQIGGEWDAITGSCSR